MHVRATWHSLRVVKDNKKLPKLIQEMATVLVGALALVACTTGRAVPPVPTDSGQTLIAAGDIAQCGRSGFHGSGAEATASFIESLPGTVLALGDLAYPDGTERDFLVCYEPTWGRFKDRTRPTSGNHEHHTANAAPYYAYWADRAGAVGEGFYSFELGPWHIVALNSNILDGPLASKQEEWLAADLEAHPTPCTLAFFHHPRFSSGGHGSNTRLSPLWGILYRQGVDVVLNGHDHDYERFAPQDLDGRRDPRKGIREFVVGTGGAGPTPFLWIRPNSEVRITGVYGVLRMTLLADRYKWEFLSAPDSRVLDSGTGECH
jgi:hypothetical protein